MSARTVIAVVTAASLSAHAVAAQGTIDRSPNISGEYSASTRVGGRFNCPSPLRRMVYSIVQLPLSTYS